MLYDKYGRAYTQDRKEAYTYRFPDKSEDWAQKNRQSQGNVYQKMIKMYHYDPKTKIYWLPPKNHNKNFNLVEDKIEVKDTSHFFQTKEGSNFNSLVTGQKESIDTTIEELKNGSHSGLIISTVGTGKALAYDEKIFGPTGWYNIGDAKVGDKIYDRSGKLVEITGVYPQGVRDIYEVSFYDGTKIKADGDHLWQVENDRPFLKNNIKTTLELYNDKFLVKSRTSKAGNIEYQYKYGTPICSAMEFPEKKYLIHPYVLGVLIGDGSLGHGANVTIADDGIYEKVDLLLREVGYYLHRKKGKDGISYNIKSLYTDWCKKGENEIIGELRRLGLLGKRSIDKFIPEEYMYGSVDQRLELLRGLMDTDGTCDKSHGAAEFYSSSFQLINDCSSLIRSLGYFVPKNRERIGKYKKDGVVQICNKAYTIAVKTKENPFYLKRKAKRYVLPGVRGFRTRNSITGIRYIGKEPAICIAVNNQDHLFITTNYIVTHNTVQMLGIVDKLRTKTLITVPSEAIGQGIYDKFKDYCDIAFLNGAKIRTYYKKHGKLPDVLVAHRQSVVNCYDLLNGYYDLLINDEQHHLSDGMKMICNMWKGKWIVGFTGTPFRKEMEREDFEQWYFDFIYDTGLESLPVQVFTHKFRHTYSARDFLNASEGLNPEAPEVQRRLLNSNPKRIEELKKVIKRLYFELGFRKIMVFVDRREYQEEIAKHFSNPILINGDSNKKEVLDKMALEDQYLAIGIVGASGEGFDAPGVEIGILFYSTKWEGSLEQMIGRARRFGKGKTKAYWLDFQDYSMIEPNLRKNFGASQRVKYYKERGRDVKEFSLVKTLD